MSGGTHDLDSPAPHPPSPTGLSPPAVTRSSGLRLTACDSRRGGCRPLQPTRPTPRRHRRQAVPPAGFGLLPVRSPLLRESSLFLGVLRCFSSPGALPGSLLRCPAVRRAGCPIRRPPDRRLPAPPRGISPRGRVLPRPPTPRHPPCALHAESRLRLHPRSPSRQLGAGPARASRDVPPSHDPTPARSHRDSPIRLARPARIGWPRPAPPPRGRCCRRQRMSCL